MSNPGNETNDIQANQIKEDILNRCRQPYETRRITEESAQRLIGVSRMRAYAGLTPGMRLEVHFENLESWRCRVLLIDQTSPALALVPDFILMASDIEPVPYVTSRIYPATQLPGKKTWTLLDPRGEITDLLPDPGHEPLETWMERMQSERYNHLLDIPAADEHADED